VSRDGDQRGRTVLVDRVLLFAAAGLAVLLPLFLAPAPLASPETFLHLEAGRLIARTGPYQAEEPFLHAAEEGPPRFGSWLGDLLLFRTWEAWGPGGLRGLAAVLAVLLAALLVAYLARHTSGPLLVVLGLVLADWLLLPYLHPTPTLMALPLLVAGFLFLSGGDRPVPALRIPSAFLLAALAVNLDPEMAFAFLALYAVFFAVQLLRALSGLGTGEPDLPDFRYLLTHLAALLAIAAGTLANPWHYRLPIILWERAVFWSALLPDRTFLNPLGPGLSPAPLAGALGAITILGLNLAGRFLGHGERRGGVAAPALLAASLVATAGALLSVRHVWLLLLPLLYGVRRGSPMGAALASRSEAPAVRRALLRSALLLLVLGAAGLITALEPRVRATYRRVAVLEEYLVEDVDAQVLPADAARFLQEAGVGGPLFNEPAWGGYLSHALAGSPVFLDSRLGRVPAHVREAAAGVLPGGEEAGRLLGDYDLHLAVLRADRPPPGKPGEWARVFRNSLAAVYMRHAPQTLGRFVRAARYYRHHAIPQGVAERFEEAVVIEANPVWAADFRILGEGVLNQILKLYRQMAQAREREERVAVLRRLGNLYAGLGLYDSALREWSRGLQLRERDRNLLYNIGVAQLRLQRPEEARRTFQTYRVLYPEDQEADRILRALDQDLSF